MQINRKSIVVGLTVGALAGGAGGAIAATTGSGSGVTSKTSSWAAGGWSGPGPWGANNSGWRGPSGWNGSSGSPGYGGAWAGYAGARAAVARVGREAAQSYLGLSASDLQSRLDSGRTLAQIASDRGRSVPGLESTIETAARRGIASDSALSADAKSTLLAHVRTVVDAVVAGTGPVAAWGR